MALKALSWPWLRKGVSVRAAPPSERPEVSRYQGVGLKVVAPVALFTVIPKIVPDLDLLPTWNESGPSEPKLTFLEPASAVAFVAQLFSFVNLMEGSMAFSVAAVAVERSRVST